jgi:hypothetical protein
MGVPPGAGVEPDSPIDVIPADDGVGVMITADDQVPGCVGANVTVTATFSPGATVAPGAGPAVMENGAAGLPSVTVNGAPPVFDSVNDLATDAPTATEPKANEVGDTVSCGPGGGAGVEPDNATDVGVADSDVAIGMDDDHVPPWVGAKVTVTVTDWPGESDDPAAGAPDIVNGAAGAPIDAIVNADPPVLVIEKVFANVAPAATEPNANDVGDTASAPAAGALPPYVAEKFVTACWSVAPPVPAEKPTRTFGGTLTGASHSASASILTNT